MPENSIKLTNSISSLIVPCLLCAAAAVFIYLNTTLTPLIWIVLTILSLVAVYNGVRLLIGETILLICNEGMKYEGKMMKWENITDFETVTYRDAETGDATHLVLKLSNSYLNVDINISRLDTDETQIREWIKMYSVLPVDKGHCTTSI